MHKNTYFLKSNENENFCNNKLLNTIFRFDAKKISLAYVSSNSIDIQINLTNL